MTHGTHCHCMLCTVGKKMGMIHKEDGSKSNADNTNECQHCGHVHSTDSNCDCEHK